MQRRQGGGLRLSGLRLVVVALSAVGFITTYSALELFRFGEVSAALHDRIETASRREQALTAVTRALGAFALADTPETRLALTDAIAAVAAGNSEAAESLAPLAKGFLEDRSPSTALPERLAGLAASETGQIEQNIALWDEASASVSWVLSLSLASIVVLLFTVVLRTLAYLSARDRTEAQLRRATAEAEAANLAKTDFLATISHEIRTPLTAIRGYSDLLATSRLTSVQRDRLDRLRDANGALALLIDDILDLSKIEAGEFELQAAPFDIAALVEGVAALVKPAAMAKGLTVACSIDPALPRILSGDRGRLAQVLLNLANNAVKFTQTGAVNLTAKAQADRLVLTVTDTGIGIAAADISKLFKRFSQIDSSLSRAHAGTGLGLAISRGLVLRMGGEIAVESEPGSGTRFTVTLPLRPAGAAALPAAPDDPPPVSLARPARVLVVEDSPQNQDLIQTVLLRDGHHCTAAWDGIEGVQAASDADFDLLIMDMQMPHMDGIAATAAIRALGGPRGRVPILALSANALAHQVAAMTKAGADRHLAKPFAIADLSRVVSDMLGHASQALPEGTQADAGTAKGATDIARPDRDPSDPDRTESDLAGASLLELVALLGRDPVSRRLTDVLDALDWTGKAGDPVTERHLAHRLISDAGQLGLTALAAAAAALEQALDARADAAPARDRLHAEARHARTRLPQILALIDRA